MSAVSGRTHRPAVDADKCSTCGGCTWRCPAAVFKELGAEPHSLRGAIFSRRPFQGEHPELPPCRLACPLGQDVPGYIAAIASKELALAARLVRSTNALPSICGRACVASCMRACVRAGIDEGLDIRGLKRFAVEACDATLVKRTDLQRNAKTVAIIGAGPAGLAAAHRLLELGVKPIVLEAGSRGGGLFAGVVAPFVLPSAVLERDVQALVAAGVELQLGVRVGQDIAWEAVEGRHAAVLLTTGAGRGVVPALEGRELQGVEDVISFSRRVYSATVAPRIAGPAVVQGGGKAALQAARALRRLGCETVHVVHSAPLALWPAGADDLGRAEAEGVQLRPLTAVHAFQGTQALAAVLIRPYRELGQDAVARPKLLLGSKQEALAAALFLAADDRRPADGARPVLPGITLGRLGNASVDAHYRLLRPKWYAAGEAATGAATVVDSMATGRRAADAIAEDLAGGRS